MGTSIIHIKSEIECKVFLFDEEKGIATPGKYLNLVVRKGKQEFLFVDVSDATVKCIKILNIDNECFDYTLEVSTSDFYYEHTWGLVNQNIKTGDFELKLKGGSLESETDVVVHGQSWYEFNIGLSHYNDGNYQEAFSWFLKASNKGDANSANSMLYIGRCYEFGLDVNQIYAYAAKWYHKAASLGQSEAQLYLGILYSKGRGVKQNIETAIFWLRQAAEHGEVGAMVNLGVMYTNGISIQKKYEEAVKWTRMAAEKGSDIGQFNLGWLFMEGRNYVEALKWYRMAAEQNYAPAILNIGVCYMKGLGVAKNIIVAKKWFEKLVVQEAGDITSTQQEAIEIAKKNLKEIAIEQSEQENVSTDQVYSIREFSKFKGMPTKAGVIIVMDYFNSKWEQKGLFFGDQPVVFTSEILEEHPNHNAYEIAKDIICNASKYCVKRTTFFKTIHGNPVYIIKSSRNNQSEKNKENTKATPSPYFLFFDTETTGVPRNYNAPACDTRNWPRLVQIGWVLTDENDNTISSGCEIVKPDGFIIPSNAVNVHGITTEKAKKEGKPLREVIDRFLIDAKQAKIIVGHNISFDKHVIGAELCRLGIQDTISKAKSICTMELGTDFCKIPGSYGYKWPKLQELYRKLFGTNFEEAHDAMADIKATKKCFFELKRLGVVKN